MEKEIILNEARKKFSAGLYVEAIANYSQLLSMEPNTARYLINRAMCNLKLSNWAEAFKDAKTASEIERSSAKAWYIMGKSCDKLCMRNEALEHLNVSFELDICNKEISGYLESLIKQEFDKLANTFGFGNMDERYENMQMIFQDLSIMNKLEKEKKDLLNERQSSLMKSYVRMKNSINSGTISEEGRSVLSMVWQSILNDYGVLCKPLGNYQLALSCHLLAYHFIRLNEQATPQIHSTLIGNIALDFKILGKTDMAKKYIIKAIEIDERNDSSLELAQHLNRFATIHMAEGRHNEALNVLMKQENLCRDKEKLKVLWAKSIGDQGLIYRHLQLFEKSLEFLKKAMKMCEKCLDRENVWLYISAIGDCYIFLNRPLEAVEYFKMNESIYKTEYTKLINWDRLGTAYFAAWDHKVNNNEYLILAKEYLEKAWELGKKRFDIVRVSCGASLAQVYSELHDSRAKDLFEEVIVLSKNSNLLQLYAENCTLYATYLFQQGDKQNALEYLLKADETFDQIWKALVHDEYIVSWTNKAACSRCTSFLQLVYLTSGQSDLSFSKAIKNRSRSLKIEMTKRNLLNEQQVNFEYVLKFVQNNNATILFFSQVAIEFILLYMFLPNGEFQLIILQLSEDLSPTDLLLDVVNTRNIKTVRTFSISKTTAEESSNNSSTNFGEFCDILLANLMDNSDISKLYVIPDGNLSTIPFSTLKPSENYQLSSQNRCKLLLDKFQISILPTIAILKEAYLESDNTYTDQVLITGISNFSYVGGVHNLPNALIECENVAKILNGSFRTTYLINEMAQKYIVLKQLEKIRLFHVASHADMDPDKNIYIPGSLVVYPDNSATNQDIFITAAEIQQLDLSRMDLAFLNCCNTGKGKVYSEGLLGLGRAFLFAGAKAVILSLWEVLDCSEICQFVEEFYQEFLRDFDASRALRKAQLNACERNIPEHIWAPFYVLTFLKEN